jgi:hypothetical protein
MSLPTDEQNLKPHQNISNLLTCNNQLYTMGNTPDPTPENIAIVKTNLSNIQAFNDYIYSNGQAYFTNCFLLMTSTDNSDPGLSVGLNLLEGSFTALGAGYGDVGAFAACFMCGEVDSWSSTTPPNLNAVFASMLIRYQQSSFTFDAQVANYISDPASFWTKTFYWKGQSCVLGDLASISFPDETVPSFFPMAKVCLTGLDQAVWQQVLKQKCVITWWAWIPDGQVGAQPKWISSSTNMVSWDENFISKNPAYYATWTWHQDTGRMDKDYWYTYEYNLGFGASAFHDGSISSDACKYLFIDSSDGVVINTNGLIARKVVFEDWGIKKATNT